MAYNDFKNAVTYQVASKAIDSVIKYINDPDKRQDKLLKLVDLSQKLMGDKFRKEVFDGARNLISDDQNKWMIYVNKLINELDPNVVKMHALNLGYQSAFYGYSKTQELAKKYGYKIPWIVLVDPTSACNMHCKGCWAAEYGKSLNLSYEELDDIITQGEKLGIYFYMMTGGDPLTRKNDILKLAKVHNKCVFHLFTNGTLVDEELCKDMKQLGNISLSVSIEGFEEANDFRRGDGCFNKVCESMKLLKENGLLFGTSICYTSKNYKVVTSDEFLDFLIENGVRYTWYFHYMPVGNDATTELLLTPEQREYMYHRVREIRGNIGGKPIYAFDFQNDGEYVGGCIAGGRFYCHINPNGDVEPCVFIHYSNANIHDMSLLECLGQPLFREYQKGQPFNDNPLKPCPMLENPECLQELVEKTGAKSTDMKSPESPCSLCGKCEPYAKNWAPTADRLFTENPPTRKIKKGVSTNLNKTN